MTFLHPALLAAGLACIAIPIIIHLLMNRRRKPVMWGAMRFLEEAFRRTRRRLLLEKWLLLAARCLMLALLALAVGRPLLGALGGGGGAGRTFFIVIDNSIASQATDEAGKSALSRHVAAAREVLATLRPLGGGGGSAGGDRVALITLGHPAEGLVLPASPDAGAVGALLDGLEATDSRADMAGAMSLIGAALAPDESGKSRTDAGSAYVVVLSDFLEGSADLGPGGGGTGAASISGAKLPRGVRVLATEPTSDGATNVTVAGVEPLRAVLVGAGEGDGAGEQVRVALRRSGPGVGAAAATVVRARISAPEADAEDAGESRAVVRWSPGQESATTAIALAPPASRGTATEGAAGRLGAAVITVLIDRDALDGDNVWRRPVEVRESLRVGVVAPTRFGRAGGADKLDAASWLRLALSPTAEGAPGGGIEVVSIEPASMDAARLAGLDAVVLPRPDLLGEGAWARVRLFIEGGGLVLVMPPPGVTVHLWGDEMIRVLEPGFALSREARILAAGAEGARPVIVATRTPAGDSGGLLSLIEGELTELLRPVSIAKVLPMLPGTAAAGGGAQAGMPGQTLLALQDGTPLLWIGGVGVRETEESSRSAGGEGRGMLAYLATALDLEWTDLPTKPLMVPLLNELVMQGVGRAKGATWTLAGNRPLVGRRATELVRLGTGEGSRSIRVDDEGFAGEAIRTAGLWQARDDRGTRRSVLAVNPDAAGSRTGALARDAVGAWLGSAVATTENSGDLGATVAWLPREGGAATAGAAGSVRGALSAAIGVAERGAPISLPLLVALLALAVVELVLGRWASHASVVSAELPRGAAMGGAA